MLGITRAVFAHSRNRPIKGPTEASCKMDSAILLVVVVVLLLLLLLQPAV